MKTPTSLFFERSKCIFFRFNTYLGIVGAITLLVHLSLPRILRYIHPCARHIDTDLLGFCTAFVMVGFAVNVLFFGFRWLFTRSEILLQRIQAPVFWGLLVCTGWLMLNGFLTYTLPILLSDPEMLCD
jgi:hypothetical protein